MTQRGVSLLRRIRGLLPARTGAGQELSEPMQAVPAAEQDAGHDEATEEAKAAANKAAAIAALGGRRFLIVTPVFNAAAFIDEAIASVLRQSLTDHVLHYHVQDGGSTDGTVDRLRAWQRRLHNDGYFPDADRIVFTFASERDSGMYDALQRGFDRLAPRDDDILTWINSDDCLAQGSLVTVGGVFRDVPDCEFLSGRTALLSEAGAVVLLAGAQPFARDALAGGQHDGRALPFVMQEGTFYSGRVWNAVGGVDTSFRLAGDWDLWRRIARVARHCIVDTVTGYHRRRAGQLSGDMDAYYREIDAAPALPDATGLGSLGTLITYDVPGARWIEAAYDPALVTAPVLLRDGRSEHSVVCRPVAGFGAPEGPYAQYQLPGGIRWINGNSAELALVAPHAGRHRLRLTVRPSHQQLVVGLGIGARASQPITLEIPAPLTDQVIETVRWLDAGENRLIIDCDGPPRSLLLVRCDVTSIDEAFLRRPALPPVRAGRTARSVPAIAILCDDDEPDLLETSLVSCATLMPGAPVFVVRDPRHDAVSAVLYARHALVAGVINAPVALEPLRRRLHAAGHADVLVVQRGSLPVPRGIDAAATLLDATGAAAAGGLVNERDSDGSALQLSVPHAGVPILYRAEGSGEAPLRIGCALVQAIARAAPARCETRVVWLLDGDRPMLGRTPAALLAGALALLGHDVRHVVVAPGAWPVPPPGALVIASYGLTGAPAAAMTIGRDGDRLRLARVGDAALDLPLGVDTDLLLPQDRAAARARLGFASDARVLCIAEHSAQGTAATLAWVAAMPGGPARILNFGAPPPASVPAYDLIALDAVDDPLLLSWLLSAADAAVTAEPGGGMLAGAAWCCGLPVFDLTGAALYPDPVAGDPPAADRARDLMLVSRSLAALAIAINARCPDLGSRGAASLDLRGGAVRVRSQGSDRQGGFDRVAGFNRVTMLGETRPFDAADGERGLSICGRGGELFVSLDHAGTTTLLVHVRGTPGDAWTVEIGGGTTALQIDADGTSTAAVSGDYDIGPARITFERDGDDPAGPPLHVVGLSATGAAMALPRGWEETRFELVSADAGEAARLEVDGDWCRVSGFLSAQAPVSPPGLLVPFQWNLGEECRVRVRVATGGPRRLRLALSAGMRAQRVRVVVAGKIYDWSSALAGPIGHIERRAWLIDWPTGDVDVRIEVDEVLRTMPQEVGMILFAVTLDPV